MFHFYDKFAKQIGSASEMNSQHITYIFKDYLGMCGRGHVNTHVQAQKSDMNFSENLFKNLIKSC